VSARGIFPILVRGIIPLFRLGVSLFVSPSGAFSRFLHRVGGGLLLFAIFRGTHSLLLRGALADSSLVAAQGDPLFPRLFLLFGSATLAILLFGLADRFLLSRRVERELPLLLLLLHVGGVVALFLSTAREILLALERVTLASYVLATLERQNRHSTYAGVQYFLLGSLPSASLFLAFALFYLHGGALTLPDLDLLLTPLSAYAALNSAGSFDFGVFSSFFISETSSELYAAFPSALLSSPADLSSVLAFPLDSILASISPLTPLTLRGLSLLLFNLLFKLTAAPFSFWAPTVYGKAPIAAVTVLALYSKRRVFYLLAKIAPIFFVPFASLLTPTLLVLAVFSLVIGRRGAFPETILKRFFVYTSRGHVGFRLAGLALFQVDGVAASLHYLPVYAITSRITWFLLLTRGRRLAHLSQLAALRQGEPLLGLLLSLLLFSRSGLPPLAGFFVKLEVLRALVNTGHSSVAYILLLGTVATFFYYLRAIKLIFFDTLPSDLAISSSVSLPVRGDRPSHTLRLTLRCGLSLLLLLYLFILQSPLLAVQAELISALFLFLIP
jgi:NADH-quinone oxidoreductase subunit N